MQGVILSLVRHAVAAIVVWLTGKLALTPEQAGEVATGLTAAGAALLFAVYAVVEKLLKPLFFRWFGEVQPGEVPPTKHDLELAKEAAAVKP